MFLRQNPNATMHQIEESLDGNLCRCTGYRPLLDAAKTFASDFDESMLGQMSSELRALLREPLEELPAPPAALSKWSDPEHARLAIRGRNIDWYRPTSYAELLSLVERFPDARIFSGHTEGIIEQRQQLRHYPVQISPRWVNEVHVLEQGTTLLDGRPALVIGSAVRLAQLQEYTKDSDRQSSFPALKAIAQQLRFFAGQQVRFVGSVGGNIATASPISDLNPVWVAADAEFELESRADGVRVVKARDFFQGYRKVNVRDGEILRSVRIPLQPAHTEEGTHNFFVGYKQARRRDDDIAIVTTSMRASVRPSETDSTRYVVADCGFGWGGMAPRTVPSLRVEQYLCGRQLPLSEEEQAEVERLLRDEDLAMPDDAPGGMVPYRRKLAVNFLRRFLWSVQYQLHRCTGGVVPDVDPRVVSALEVMERPVSRGTQHFRLAGEPTDAEGSNPPAAYYPHRHMAADRQADGMAEYTTDIPYPPNTVHGALLTSSRPHARIHSIDASEALAMEGVHGFYSAKDIPGNNQIGPVFRDEELFASETVLAHGFPIGIVVADTAHQARLATAKIKVEYEDLPAILTMDDAIAKESFYRETIHELDTTRGSRNRYDNPAVDHRDLEEVFAECEHVLEGEVRNGGQEHFYLEPQATLCVPGEGGEMMVYSSTQNPTHTQSVVADLLGVPKHEVVARVRRLGGGFGGKESRSFYVSGAAAVAARALNRPVRLVLDRDVDMSTSGGRHPFLSRYRVGFNGQGVLQAVDIKLHNDAGYSQDLSFSVMDRALFHCENAYRVPHLRALGRGLRTNLTTNTAYRGFGGPQGMLVAETYVDRVAHHLGLEADEVRERNFYQEGDVTPYGQQLRDVRLQEVWCRLKEDAQVQERREAVREHNARHRYRKRGLAAIPTKFGMSFTAKHMNQAGALVHVYTDGSVLVSHGGTEMGQGLNTKVCQVVAHALQVPLEQVRCVEAATDKVPNTSPTAASVGSDINGAAALDACRKLLARMEPIRRRHPELRTLAALASRCYMERVSLSATGFYATPDIGYDWAEGGEKRDPFYYYVYGAAASEVEVCALTGDHEVLRSDVVMEVGNSINPALDIGQVEGAFIQGYGWNTLEELVRDPRTGQLISRGPGSYKVPSFASVPQQFNVTLLSDNPNHQPTVLRSKGIGEPPFFMGSSVFFAIRNAIADARREAGRTNYFLLDSPATCERILTAVEQD